MFRSALVACNFLTLDLKILKILGKKKDFKVLGFLQLLYLKLPVTFY
jgi:hypothetical protein